MSLDEAVAYALDISLDELRSGHPGTSGTA